ncbi:MAG: ATP-dependent DNA helicase RecG, partial [Chitinophagales bacterium]
QRAELLNKELGIFTFKDLLDHFPFRFVDRSKIYTIAEAPVNEAAIQLKGYIRNVRTIPQKRGQRMVATLEDESGQMELLWFRGLHWISKYLLPNTLYIVFGKPGFFNGKKNIVHPEIEILKEQQADLKLGFSPVYNSTEKLKNRGLDSKGIQKLTAHLLSEIKDSDLPEFLPQSIINKYRFPLRAKAYREIHKPGNPRALKMAQARLKFDELFLLQMKIVGSRQYRKVNIPGQVFDQVGTNFNALYKSLPFKLTKAQENAIRDVRKDSLSGKQMNRLIQGDVGSGKTVVALLCMMLALDNGFQSCMMAPTEILAQQHFKGISEQLEKLPVKVAILTGSIKGKERKQILTALSAGEIDLLIGTHALLEGNVVFKNLGFVVIDEQHRFGVAQRAKLWKKNTKPPHILVMTATPIPRTLAMTVYGDLDTSLIDELPPGRKPIQTLHYFENKRLKMHGFMRKQIELGRQVYVVFPLINESETLDYKDLMDGYESISRAFSMPEFHVSVVHGQMKPQDKEMEMQRFAAGKTHIMVATTVIEVGVNVPNASVMVIESAERFGLSQLHQLRGRVGRGADQSYCILMTGPKLSNEARIRMDTMVRTNNGFEISEVDLKLRGPGDIEGTQQSGITQLKLADLSKDQKILQEARICAEEILDNDARLEKPEHQVLLKYLIVHSKQEKTNWSLIS